jgi:hypothetical protein
VSCPLGHPPARLGSRMWSKMWFIAYIAKKGKFFQLDANHDERALRRDFRP